MMQHHCQQCWVRLAIFERLHDYVEGGGGHHANDERGWPKRCFNKCFLHYILDLMFWHHSHDFSPLRVNYYFGHTWVGIL